MAQQPNTYRFSPLDVAAYIKWSQVNAEGEFVVLETLWSLRKTYLDKRCGTRFERFKRVVYDELYRLWSRGYTDERAALSRSLDLERYPLSLFPEREAELERYLILLALHFLLTPRLPQLSLRWSVSLRMCGQKKATKRLWKRIVSALEALGLELLLPNRTAYGEAEFLADTAAVLQRRS